ncbi:SDR family oxidoreductase [Sediminibacterium roseum]|uniref:SDR family oxidoreductase n=1 Tax=Sediminibacterium roseum TaxID=1978412 RepID=A0ABW9ZRD5_9BACT|nr:SDR family oxidoreductase [Sediminibacterium roseum]NCI49027.1 SDR family oxidoreductase [Sediminibacterium roseum]
MRSYLEDLFNVEGKVVLLTGAGGHLVGEMSRSLAKAGMKIVCCDFSKEAADKVVTDIKAAGGDGVAVQMDVRLAADHQRALQVALDTYGQLDCVLNGAGSNAPTDFFEIPLEEWNNIIAVQLTGTMLACQVYGKYMVERRSGSIINISSASSGPPLSKAFTYSVAKSGVKNLTQNLAREWGTMGVRVNALRPGFFPTEWSMQHFITPEREAAILGHTGMKRYGKPNELVGAVLWMFSDAAGFVTGAEIAVDGGFTAMTI